MPDGPDNPSIQVQRPPTAPLRVGGLRLSGLAGGAMGLLGFALAVIVGLSAGNAASQIICRALVAMFLLACVGGLAGAIAARVVVERMERIAREQVAVEAELAAKAEAARQAGSTQETAETGKTDEGPREG